SRRSSGHRTCLFGLSHRPRDGSVVSSLHCMNDPQPEGHMASHIERRKFLATLLSGAAASLAGSPFAVARQAAMPLIGFVNAGSAKGGYARPVSAFRQGLSETGYVEGRNVAIEWRWAEGQYDRLPALIADLVHSKVKVIVATGTSAALPAKAAITPIPIVFTPAADPVPLGLVGSLGRPGGNVTGATKLNVEVAPKRLELLHEVIPTATAVAVLLNPSNPNGELTWRRLQPAAGVLGIKLHPLHATSDFAAV